jgi:cyclophilin family peptidyl-prolyl cis-trans isomerase
MRDFLLLTSTMLIALGLVLTSFGAASAKDNANPIVTIKTNLGDITVELYPDKAPETVQNFLWYVDSKFYEGLVFHRVMPNFMIQAGGHTKDMVRKETRPAIKNEASNGLSNLRGTIAMARLGEPHSATSQFYINVKDNQPLDFKNKDSAQGWGYCVFGKVISGMDTVDKIRQVPTMSKDGYNDVPVEPVLITKVYKPTKEEIDALKAKKKP